MIPRLGFALLTIALLACDGDGVKSQTADGAVTDGGAVADGGVVADGGGGSPDSGPALPGPHRFGFLSSYGIPGVASEWSKQGKDLVQESSKMIKELGTRWTRESYFIYPEPTALSAKQQKVQAQAEKDGLTVVATIGGRAALPRQEDRDHGLGGEGDPSQLGQA